MRSWVRMVDVTAAAVLAVPPVPGPTDLTFLNSCKKASYPEEYFEQAKGKQSEAGFLILHTSSKVFYTVTESARAHSCILS